MLSTHITKSTVNIYIKAHAWTNVYTLYHRAKSNVAAFIRTDVTKYKDNQDLFKLAESTFGGVDVRSY